MAETIFQITVICYFLATLHYLLYLAFKTRLVIARTATGFAVLGFTLHTAVLGAYVASHSRLPVSTHTDILSLFVWAMMLIYLLAEWRHKIWVFGSFVLPLATLAGLYSAVLPSRIEIIPPPAKTIFLTFHVSLATIGFASFGFAFCMGIMYLIQERQLKSHRLGALFYRLPSLDMLDKLTYRCLSVGFPVLTLSIILGVLWIVNNRTSVFTWKPVEIWWLMIWVFYAVLLQARFTLGWRGRKASYLAIVTFLLACIPFMNP